mmetsp:Transcript_9305/g.23911  ORF Transcript_9305/g.23911 Transcript_9305/m.23911 type:complete len:590 (-) Transcript_9305:1781-3550(-)
MAGRPNTGRLMTAARATSYGSRAPGTAGGGRPTTGRLPTGAIRPGTGKVKMPDRVLTQQGLDRLGTAPRTSYGRTVQDASYFLGSLRTKVSELTTEIAKLKREVAQHERDESSYNSYEKRAEALAGEIKALQGELSDLNLMNEQIDKKVEVAEVLADKDDLKKRNDKESKDIDDIFAARSKLDADTKKVEEAIAEVKAHREEIVRGMGPEHAAAYAEMTAENEQFVKEIDAHEATLAQLNSRAAQNEVELQQNPLKRDAIRLYDQISQMEAKRDQIAAEMEAEKEQSPEEQRQRLLDSVKSDNQEIAGMEHKMEEVSTRISDLESEMTTLDEDDSSGKLDKRTVQYKELVKKDKQMATFLESYDENFTEATKKIEECENRTVELLRQISTAIERGAQLPDAESYAQDKSLLNFKQNQLSKSEQTANALDTKVARLRKDQASVEALESKITVELANLEEQIATMKTGLVTYDDIVGLKESKELLKKRLIADKRRLVQRREITKRLIQESAHAYEKASSELNAEGTYSQLHALEKKWQALEKSNFQMHQYITTKESEAYFKHFAADVTKMVKEYNGILKTRETTVKQGIAT